MRSMTLGIIAALAALQGCQNSCQQVCVNMAEFRDECGITASDAEVDSCLDAMKDAEKEDLQTCSEMGSMTLLRARWNCEDVNLFRDVQESLTEE